MNTFKGILLIMLVSIVPYVSANAKVDSSLPSHNGKCGDLTDSNTGSGIGLKNCKRGDVVLLKGYLLPRYCDYRYQIIPYDEATGNFEYYTCILRIEQE